MGIDDYLIALRRHWRVVVAAIALAVAVAWVTTTVAPPRPAAVSYSATAVLLNSGSLAGSIPGSIPGASSSLDTVATLATLEPVVQQVADAVGYDGDLQLLATRVRAVADPTSPGILRITASAGDAEESALIANTFASELIDYLQTNQKQTAEGNLASVNQQLAQASNRIAKIEAELQTATAEEATILEAKKTGLTSRIGSLGALYQQYLGESLQPPAFEIVEQATPVAITAKGLQPPRSRTARVSIAALLGLLGGLAIALALQRFDKRIRTTESAERALRAPVLAEIPLIPKHERGGIVVVEHPHSAATEALRLLGAGLIQGPASAAALNGGRRREGRRDERRSKVVLVTSAAPGEGKTTVVANLAVILGETGKRVLVLSCDFRRPTIHELLEVPNLHGLADVLRESNSPQILNGCVVDTRFDGVSIAPSGTSFDRPGEILGSEAMPRAFREARARADVVLVDTAPILAASDAAHLIPGADEVIVVARAGVVTTSLAHRTREVLERLQSPQIGVVLNGAQETALPPGYREYFRRIPDLPEEETEMGETPPYRVPDEADTV